MAKILLIDDSESLIGCIERILLDGGHSVCATTSGAQAVVALAEQRFDVVVTDLYMPPPDGFEIIQAVRDLGRPLPLIVMSTNPLACDVFRAARALGAVAALQKPFSAETLLRTISGSLRPAAPGSGADQVSSTFHSSTSKP